jgi:hypothetical protein
MLNGELEAKKTELENVLASALSGKLIYAINKNIERLERELKILDTVRKPSAKFNEFEQKRVALCTSACNKDERGQPKTVVTPNGLEYDIIDRPAFDANLETLKEEYKDVIEAHREALVRYGKLMEAENDDLKIYKIKYSVLEREQSELELKSRISGSQTRQIWFMIEDDIEPEAVEKPQDTELKMLK